MQAAPNLHGFCAVFPRDVFFEAFGAAGGGAGAVTGDTLAGVMKITEGDAMEEPCVLDAESRHTNLAFARSPWTIAFVSKPLYTCLQFSS